MRTGFCQPHFPGEFALARRDEREAVADVLDGLFGQGVDHAVTRRNVLDDVGQCLAHDAQDALFLAEGGFHVLR
jgi:hypothetical protein